MKPLEELNLPDSVRYLEEHTWARRDGDLVIVGISDYAQDQLGDITFLDLPEAGDTFSKGEQFGAVESAKSLSDLYMPVTGTIESVHTELDDDPEIVNRDPYGEGWLLAVKPDDPAEIDGLLTNDGYLDYLSGMERIE